MSVHYGLDESLLSPISESHRIHIKALEPFRRLQEIARQDGFEIGVASAFRSFERQLQIWNEKALGHRELRDRNGQLVLAQKLKPLERMWTILNWSALPGASRHHWGTDLDIFDKNALSGGYTLKLIPEEIEPNQPFFEFGNWLTETLPKEGFYRPYQSPGLGVQPEWWHISYRPEADRLLGSFDTEVLRGILEKTRIELKEEILSHLGKIISRYLRNTNVS